MKLRETETHCSCQNGSYEHLKKKTKKRQSYNIHLVIKADIFSAQPVVEIILQEILRGLPCSPIYGTGQLSWSLRSLKDVATC
jgi:hypothetical protein